MVDRASIVRVDFVNVKVDHGRGHAGLSRAVLVLGRVCSGDHHDGITEAKPQHGASVRSVDSSFFSKAECGGQEFKCDSLVRVS
jgi:hypothetical protein